MGLTATAKMRQVKATKETLVGSAEIISRAENLTDALQLSVKGGITPALDECLINLEHQIAAFRVRNSNGVKLPRRPVVIEGFPDEASQTD